MSKSHQTYDPGRPGIFSWLVAGILSVFLGALNTPALAWDTILFEDHFDNQDSLNNWILDSRERIEDQRFCFSAWIGHRCICTAYATLKLDPLGNFEVSVKLHPMDVPEGIIFIREQAHYPSGVGKAYSLRFGRVTEASPGDPIQYDHITLNRVDCLAYYEGGCYDSSNQSLTEVTFSPVDVPVTARIRMEEGTLRVFLNDTQYLKFTDPNPLPPGSIRIGAIGATPGGTRMTFDDFVVKALPDIRCSSDNVVDGTDPPCTGTLVTNPVWAYVWPADDIKKVDFYLDGRFHRTERYKPWEFDGGSPSKLATGPHEIRAVVQPKYGGTKTLTSAFEVGKHSLRCSSDPVLDGNDPACEGSPTSGPQWVYWWPETGVKSVDFYLNSSQTKRTEYKAPFELAGGEPAFLTYYGWGADDQFVRSVVRFNDGRKPLTTDTHFTTSYPLRCSPDPVLDGRDDACMDLNRTEGMPEWPYWWPATGIASIELYVDDIFYRTERLAPFELDDGTGMPLGLAPGFHTVRMVVTYKGRDQPVTVEQPVYLNH